MVAEVDSKQAVANKVPRERSPAYPFISLRGAVERLARFEAMFGRHPVPADKVGLAWKMKEKSSQAFQTLAALKSFGLIDYKGANKDRVAMLTEAGRNYLRAQQEDVKAEILKACAFRPKAISTYWQRWGADRPIDTICMDQMVLKDGFTLSAANTFLKVYDETVTFSKLADGDSIHGIDEAEDEDDSENTEMQSTHTTSTPASAGQPRMPKAAMPDIPSTQSAIFIDDKYDLGDGRAFILRWPANFSKEELEEVEAWLMLMQKKIKRSVQL